MGKIIRADFVGRTRIPDGDMAIGADGLTDEDRRMLAVVGSVVATAAVVLLPRVLRILEAILAPCAELGSIVAPQVPGDQLPGPVEIAQYLSRDHRGPECGGDAS